MKVDFDLREAVSLHKPTAEMTAFTQSLRTPELRAQICAKWHPLVDITASNFKRFIKPPRSTQIKQIFMLMKEQCPQSYRELKIYRTHLGMISELNFNGFYQACMGQVGTLRDFDPRDPFLPQAREITRVACNFFVLRALAVASVPMFDQNYQAIITNNKAALARAANDDDTFLWVIVLQLAYATTDNIDLSDLDESIGASTQQIQDLIAVCIWLGAAILEYGKRPTPGFSAVKGQDPFALLRNLKF